MAANSLIDAQVRASLDLVFNAVQPLVAICAKTQNPALNPTSLALIDKDKGNASVLVQYDLGYLDSDVTVACGTYDESATVRVRFLSTIGRRWSVDAKLAAALDDLARPERRDAIIQCCIDEAIALEWPNPTRASFHFLSYPPYSATNSLAYSTYVPIVAYALLRTLRIRYRQKIALPACVASTPITPPYIEISE